ncbi:MAG: PEP-CTERM sorting domain-containing protein [Verrucomicrobiota bacterium]
MKTIKLKPVKLLGTALICFGFLSISNAGAQFSYSTDFSGTSYQSGNTLPTINNVQTQDNWFNPSATVNPYTTFIAPVSTNGPTPSYLNIGGSVLDESTPPTDFYTYAMHGINVQSNSVHFDTVFQINPGNQAVQDSFGWTLFNTAGEQLISVDLNAAGTGGTNLASSSQYTLGVTSFANDSSFNSTPFTSAMNAPATVGPIDGNTSYHFAFNVYNIGQTDATVDFFSYNSGNNVPTLLGTALIEGTDWSGVNNNTTIGILGATWVLADSPANYGNNYMAMNTLTVTSVPEPKTYVLFGIAGLIAVIALRRKSNA